MKVDINNAGTRYTLLQHESYTYPTVTVPEGFVTDFASTPKFIWCIYPPTGNYKHAALLHDFLYRYHFCTRKEADRYFREQMKLDGVGFRTRWTFWLMVRLFGKSSWLAYTPDTEK